MRRLDILLGLVLIFIVRLASAAPIDVPSKHWAATAVQSVTEKKIMGPLPDGKFYGNEPVTRYELAAALDRLVRYIEAGRRPLTVKNASKPAEHLLADGFLSAASPIVKGTGQEIVTAQQLAEALGEVTIRLSDRSLPSTKD